MNEQVSIRSHFERFPATVKGAFVIRGVDPDPHLVVIAGARAVSATGSCERQIDVEPVTLDVAPHVDVFVPFELSVADLDPGWYELECTTQVDGVDATFPGGKRFIVQWPRATVRRGHVSVGKKLAADSGPVRIEQVDLAGDSIKVHVTAQPAEAASLRFFADGAPLPVLEVEVSEDDGTGVVSAYPVFRSHETLRIEAGRDAGVDVRLP